jgi:hypothetical protein
MATSPRAPILTMRTFTGLLLGVRRPRPPGAAPRRTLSDGTGPRACLDRRREPRYPAGDGPAPHTPRGSRTGFRHRTAVPPLSAPLPADAPAGRTRPLLLYFGILPFAAVRQRPQQLALELTRFADVLYVDPPYSVFRRGAPARPRSRGRGRAGGLARSARARRAPGFGLRPRHQPPEWCADRGAHPRRTARRRIAPVARHSGILPEAAARPAVAAARAALLRHHGRLSGGLRPLAGWRDSPLARDARARCDARRHQRAHARRALRRRCPPLDHDQQRGR